MATTYFRFPPSKTIYRVVNVREFMGVDGMMCDAINERGIPSIEVALRNQMHKAEDATAEEWAAAEALALKVKAKAEADRIFREEAERYGVRVKISATSRGGVDGDAIIVRVTKARYVDSTGAQWKRMRDGSWRDGERVGQTSYWTRAINKGSIAVIEEACGGADVYDFIKAGKQKVIEVV